MFIKSDPIGKIGIHRNIPVVLQAQNAFKYFPFSLGPKKVQTEVAVINTLSPKI